jgi:hypothetical protein
MDLLSVFKTENQRELLINVLPGSIASWPYTYLIVHGLRYDVAAVLSEWTIIPIVLAFLFVSWGIGFFLTDIASNIEVRLERIYFSIKTNNKAVKIAKPFSIWDNLSVLLRLSFGWLLTMLNCWEWLLGKFVKDRLTNKTADQFHEEFYNRWNQYLSLSIGDSEPVVIRYYRGVLNRFRFELTLIAAITIMLVGHLLLFLLGSTVSIDWKLTSVYLGILIPGSTFLFIEAFKGVELLDELRKQIIDVCRNSTP